MAHWDTEVCVALFIDSSRASDTVDHQILLKRIESIGFDQESCNWSQIISVVGHKLLWLMVTSPAL